MANERRPRRHRDFARCLTTDVVTVIGIGVGYAFDFVFEQHNKDHCTCKGTPVGAAGNAAAAGAVGGWSICQQAKGGVAGAGPAGRANSIFSQVNHEEQVVDGIRCNSKWGYRGSTEGLVCRGRLGRLRGIRCRLVRLMWMANDLSTELREYLKRCGMPESIIAQCCGSTRIYHDQGALWRHRGGLHENAGRSLSRQSERLQS